MPTKLIISGMSKTLLGRQMRKWKQVEKKKKAKKNQERHPGGGLDVPSTTIVKTNIDFLFDSFALICSTCQSIVRRAEDSIHPNLPASQAS